MDSKFIPGARVQVLAPAVARKIAAGEVIDRPQSVVRELIDNAVDSGATSIKVFLTGGGLESIIVQDNGCGMTRDDLVLCCKPHATSKIKDESDLYAIQSLGFRGEALAAISAVAKVEIQTCRDKEAWVLQADGNGHETVNSHAAPQGTRVKVDHLFFNLPARKQFMKRSSSEYTQCQTVFLEKALSHPHLSFQLHHDGELRWNLAATEGPQGIADRLWAVYQKELGSRDFIHRLEGSTDGARLVILAVDPDVYRHDRRMLQTWINKRRISDFGLLQAMEYGYTGYIPGGRFPMVFTFAEIEPHLLDVNIHPAKREVKLQNFAEVHHKISSMIQEHLRRKTIRRSAPTIEDSQTAPGPHGLATATNRTFHDLRPYAPLDLGITPPSTHERALGTYRPSSGFPEPMPQLHPVTAPPLQDTPTPKAPYVYLGQIFGCFLALVQGTELIILDMHAAHERIIFDRLLADGKRQSLLVPWSFDTERVTHMWLEREESSLARLGLRFGHRGDGRWELEELPSWLKDGITEMERFLKAPHGSAEELLREAAAQVACRAAVKDGDQLDRSAAQAIIDDALELPDPRCPHGRPIWYRLDKEDLLTLIGRHL